MFFFSNFLFYKYILYIIFAVYMINNASGPPSTHRSALRLFFLASGGRGSRAVLVATCFCADLRAAATTPRGSISLVCSQHLSPHIITGNRKCSKHACCGWFPVCAFCTAMLPILCVSHTILYNHHDSIYDFARVEYMKATTSMIVYLSHMCW